MISARAGMSAPRMWRSSGRGCTVSPSAPASCASRAKSPMSGTPVRRELRNSAILLRFTESRDMPHYRRAAPRATADGIPPAGDEPATQPFHGGGSSQPTGQIMDQPIVLTPEKARGARKYGVVRYVLGVSLLLV